MRQEENGKVRKEETKTERKSKLRWNEDGKTGGGIEKCLHFVYAHKPHAMNTLNEIK
jgi:hypothetical protein